MKDPIISICIPAYKHLDYLDRLLISISMQTFRDFEVVITDDSPSEEVAQLVRKFEDEMRVRYYKNPQPLGTPENWNETIRKAKGEWIKMMHNDDWFANNDALQIFYYAIQQNKESVFFFSAFQNVDAASQKKEIVRLSFLDKYFLKSNPYHLLKKVYIGNPSCTLVRRDVTVWYDKRFKFIVDFDYYIRMIQKNGMPVYIDMILLNIGFHSEQVTGYTKYNPSVQIPENITFLNEQKKDILKNINVFDYYWRLLRNLNINSEEKLMYFLGDTKPNNDIISMINFQNNVPGTWMKIGLVSKSYMFLAYLIRNIFSK